MGVLASMQSLLVRQLVALGEPAWLQRYPHDWLVWEPGDWKVPEARGGMASTRVAQAAPARPQTGDCLCFELKLLKTATGTKVRVGRAPENDIVLNDATVSREHLVLERLKEQWVASPHPSAKPIVVRGTPAFPGAPVALGSGDQLTVGGVTLSYLSQAGLLSRIKGQGPKLP